MNFSTLNRAAILSKLTDDRFDLLVIGGGITGAGIALDAASRGLKVALVEKNDFAFGTSSRSTKLIHGGLRYLKQLEFGLVKEVGSERAILHKLAPHLVIPEKMLLPLSEKKGMGYWLTSIGLKVYDFLAGVVPEDQRRMLTRLQTLKAEPLLRTDEIKGGALYAEYRTDDARLTIEIMKAATQHGAIILNYAEVTQFQYEHKVICGVDIKDHVRHESFSVLAKAIVNATGPWVDQLRVMNQSRMSKRLHLTKGVHVVLPAEKLPVKQAIYFNVDDGRMIFAIPRGRTTYVGTTDTDYQGNIDDVHTSIEDAHYLVDAVNIMFPEATISVSDIESSWAGLRPLIFEEGKSASALSRKDEIFESSTGLISIAGGKLTGYRKMAARVVDLVIKRNFNGRQLHPCTSHTINLAQSRWKGYAEVITYTSEVHQKLGLETIDAATCHALVENFGRQCDIILDHFKRYIAYHPPERALILAQLKYTVEHEMVTTLTDFFVRRTGLINFNINLVIRYKAVVAEEMKQYLKWNDDKLIEELAALNLLLNRAQIKL